MILQAEKEGRFEQVPYLHESFSIKKVLRAYFYAALNNDFIANSNTLHLEDDDGGVFLTLYHMSYKDFRNVLILNGLGHHVPLKLQAKFFVQYYNLRAYVIN